MIPIPYRKRTHDEIRADVASAKTGDLLARNRVIQHMLRLVYKHAHGYAVRMNRMDLLEDMVQAATIGDEAESRRGGILRAIDTYDPAMGTAFSTHARGWILLELQKFLSRQGMVRHHTIGRSARIIRLRDELIEKLGEDPTYEQIRAEWEARGYPLKDGRCSRQAVQRALQRAGRVISFDALIAPDETDQRQERCPSVEADPNAMGEADIVTFLDSRLDAQRALAILPERERITIQALYGIGCTQLTVRELARSRGVSRRKIRSLRTAAIKRMRAVLLREHGNAP